MYRLTAFAIIIGFAASAADAANPGFQVRDHDPARSEAVIERLLAADPPISERKVWVFFTDKAIYDSETCSARIDAYAATLIPHAAQRRAKTMGPALADFFDLALHAPYVDGLRNLGLEVKRQSRWLNAVSVIGDAGQLRAAAALPFVSYMAPVMGYNAELPTGTAPAASSRVAGDLFNYGESRAQLEEINVLEMHNLGYSGDGVYVALLDTGFDKRHEAFADIQSDGRLIAEYDFIQDDGDVQNDGSPEDDGQHNHGTFTWSALGGFHDGDLVGPAYGASFLLAKTEETVAEHPGEEDNWVAALEWADTNGADVASSSLGWIDWYTWDDLDGDTAPSAIATDLAVDRGIVVCTSAGNQGSQDWYFIMVPADADFVVAVGAVDEFNGVAGWSSRGPTADGRTKPEVVARGVSTWCAFSLDLGGGYGGVGGTSLSCPLVAGAAALLVEAAPWASAHDIREALMLTADNASTPDNDRGWGRINTLAALEYLDDVSTPDVFGNAFTPQLVPRTNPARGRVVIDYIVPERISGDVAVNVYAADGSRVRELHVTESRGALEWDGRRADGITVPPGVYFVSLAAGEWTATTKVVLAR